MVASSSGPVGFVPNSGRHSRSCELREASVRGLLALLVVAALVLPACDDADRAIADESVQTFHRQYDASDFHAIYAATAEQFRNRTPEEDWSRLLTAVHQKAGVIVATRQASWRVDSSTAGTTRDRA